MTTVTPACHNFYETVGKCFTVQLLAAKLSPKLKVHTYYFKSSFIPAIKMTYIITSKSSTDMLYMAAWLSG